MLTKHRKERETFEVDFKYLLGTAESLQGATQDVQVAREAPGGTWTQLTTEFVVSSTVIGTRVQFTLKEAAAGEQAPGVYKIYCQVTTSQGRRPVGIVDLQVTDEVTGP